MVAELSTMSRKLRRKAGRVSYWPERRRVVETAHLVELCMQLPPSRMRGAVDAPPDVAAAAVASCWLRSDTARASSNVVPPTMKTMMSCGLWVVGKAHEASARGLPSEGWQQVRTSACGQPTTCRPPCRGTGSSSRAAGP